MGTNYQHLKRYQNFFGFDLKSNDLEYPEKYAQDAVNLIVGPNGTLEKRPGYQPHAPEGAKYGEFQYNRINASGIEAPEILGCSDTLLKLTAASLSVAYSGASATANIRVLFDPASAVYRCIIEEGTNTVLDYSLGLGRDEAVPITISQL
ncbi:MAG: hypothetical protein EBX40_07685, partial [Gammaproteobacteria bacterium]|nr:hypothetical protein [Gammaproteobacteria bacterium]